MPRLAARTVISVALGLSIVCSDVRSASTANFDEVLSAIKHEDFQAANAAFLKAAQAGDPVAQEALAEMYNEGIGVPSDRAQAIYWAEKAAGRDMPLASVILGFAHFDEPGSEAWFDRAAAAMQSMPPGIPSADVAAADLYFNGLGTYPTDKASAFDLLRDAARKGYVPAQQWLALSIRENLYDASPEGQEALEWCKKAAVGGSSAAMSHLGTYYAMKKQDRDAQFWLRRAALMGDGPASRLMKSAYGVDIGQPWRANDPHAGAPIDESNKDGPKTAQLAISVLVASAVVGMLVSSDKSSNNNDSVQDNSPDAIDTMNDYFDRDLQDHLSCIGMRDNGAGDMATTMGLSC